MEVLLEWFNRWIDLAVCVYWVWALMMGGEVKVIGWEYSDKYEVWVWIRMKLGLVL